MNATFSRWINLLDDTASPDKITHNVPFRVNAMPIAFSCDCGKNFRVAESNAGKRTKCPNCHTALIVPNVEPPAPEPSVEQKQTIPAPSEEDAAFALLSQGPDPEPTSRRLDWNQPSERAPTPASPPPNPLRDSRPSPPPVQSKPPKKKRSSDPYGLPDRKWNVNWGMVGGGVLVMLLGAGLLIGGLAANRFFIWSPIIIIGGFVSIINGLTNKG